MPSPFLVKTGFNSPTLPARGHGGARLLPVMSALRGRLRLPAGPRAYAPGDHSIEEEEKYDMDRMLSLVVVAVLALVAFVAARLPVTA